MSCGLNIPDKVCDGGYGCEAMDSDGHRCVCADTTLFAPWWSVLRVFLQREGVGYD